MPTIISGSTGISGTDGTAATPAVQGTDTNTGIFFPAADTIAFAEGGTEVMRIDSAGNVGIGTATPAQRLHVSGVSRFDGTVESSLSPFIYSWQGGTQGQVRSGLLLDGSGATLQFYTATNERARITAAGDFQFNSGYGSVATAFGCRAWVNFNGTGTVAIRGSGNVSSITDNGVGRYVINFTVAMPDTNYACVGYLNTLGSTTSWDDFGWGIFNKSASSFSFDSFLYRTNSYVDSAICDVAVFR